MQYLTLHEIIVFWLNVLVSVFIANGQIQPCYLQPPSDCCLGLFLLRAAHGWLPALPGFSCPAPQLLFLHALAVASELRSGGFTQTTKGTFRIK